MFYKTYVFVNLLYSNITTNITNVINILTNPFLYTSNLLNYLSVPYNLAREAVQDGINFISLINEGDLVNLTALLSRYFYVFSNLLINVSSAIYTSCRRLFYPRSDSDSDSSEDESDSSTQDFGLEDQSSGHPSLLSHDSLVLSWDSSSRYLPPSGSYLGTADTRCLAYLLIVDTELLGNTRPLSTNVKEVAQCAPYLRKGFPDKVNLLLGL